MFNSAAGEVLRDGAGEADRGVRLGEQPPLRLPAPPPPPLESPCPTPPGNPTILWRRGSSGDGRCETVSSGRGRRSPKLLLPSLPPPWQPPPQLRRPLRLRRLLLP